MSMALLLSALLMAAPPSSPAGQARHSTDVRVDGNDPLTLKFADALRAAIPQSRHLRPWSGDDPDDLTLAVLYDVEPHGKHFDYAVDLMQSTGDQTPNRLDSFTGSCRETALTACALDVVKKADAKVKD